MQKISYYIYYIAISIYWMKMAKVGRLRRLLKKATGAKDRRLKAMKHAALQLGWPGIQDPICAKVKEQNSQSAHEKWFQARTSFLNTKIQMIKWTQYTKKKIYSWTMLDFRPTINSVEMQLP